MTMKINTRSKKRIASIQRVTERNEQTKPLKVIDIALVEENTWLKVQQERFKW